MNAHLTDRLCLCCGKRSVWRFIKTTQENAYRVYLCFTCDLVSESEPWTDPQEDGPF